MRVSATIPALLLSLTVGAPARADPPPPLQAEQLTQAKLPASSPHWVYVMMRRSTTRFARAAVRRRQLPAPRQIDAASPWSQPVARWLGDGGGDHPRYGSRGARTDVVEFTDNSTLAVTREIVLPTKRAETVPSFFNVAYSADAHFVYTAYITPAASFGVLDPEHGTVLGEIDTAGCQLVIPSGPNRVSSLCESGRLLTVTLDAQGHEAARAMSEAFFDTDRDPVFAQGIPSGRGYIFLSFLGAVHEVDLSGAQPAFAAAPSRW
jgi:methylamine dehydrogenase heavy chain